MKKITLYLSLLTITVVAAFYFVGCKKDNQKGGCGVDPNQGGIIVKPKAIIMFYVTKDLECGIIKLQTLKNLETGNTSFNRYSAVIDRYQVIEPQCGETNTGTAWVQVDQDGTYEYTLSCNSRTFTGTVKVACGETCKSIELK